MVPRHERRRLHPSSPKKGNATAVLQPGTHAAPRLQRSRGDGRRLDAGVPGSKVSPGHVSLHLQVQRLVRHHPLQPVFLVAQLAQLLRVAGLHTAVLVAPTVEGLLADFEQLDHVGDGLALAEQPVGFPELADDLLWRVLPPLHGFLLALAGKQELSYQVDHSQGVKPEGRAETAQFTDRSFSGGRLLRRPHPTDYVIFLMTCYVPLA
jgi:hypothetical protein